MPIWVLGVLHISALVQLCFKRLIVDEAQQLGRSSTRLFELTSLIRAQHKMVMSGVLRQCNLQWCDHQPLQGLSVICKAKSNKHTGHGRVHSVMLTIDSPCRPCFVGVCSCMSVGCLCHHSTSMFCACRHAFPRGPRSRAHDIAAAVCVQQQRSSCIISGHRKARTWLAGVTGCACNEALQ